MAASKTPRIRLLHIRDEIDHLKTHLGPLTFEQFQKNYLALRATERAILIISEAVKTLPKELTQDFPEIPWQAIRAIGNIIRHEYETVDAHVLWDIVTIRLPALNDVVETLISRT